jgi:hypothetical protein
MVSLILAAAITVAPETPNDVYELVAIDLASVKPADRSYTRYLTSWPALPSQQSSLQSATAFWCNSLSWSPKLVPLQSTADGWLWRIDLRHFSWSREAWEKLAGADPYFATTSKDHKGNLIRGWLDPKVEFTVRKETGSTKAVLRADWFLARTSLDGRDEKKFFRFGRYSDFLILPKTDKELKAILRAEEKVKVPSPSGYDVFIFLLKGGAVKKSQVAKHNRGLQTTRTLIGRDESFLWESLDTNTNTGQSSVQKALAGTLERAGGEFIFSLPNGMHGYFICDGNGNRVAEVPTDIAEDNNSATQAVVVLGWKCVKCHGPNSGINGFDDVIRPQIIGKSTALAVISEGKSKKEADEERQKQEAYYLGDLKEITKKHRDSYLKVIDDTNGETPEENTANYLKWIEGYLYNFVDRDAAIRETGYGENFDYYVKHTSPGSEYAPLTNKPPVSITRENFEEDFARVMQARIWPWEVKK